MQAAALPVNEEARLRRLLDLQILDTPGEEAFDVLAQLASRTAGAPIALISLVDDARQWFKASVGLPGVASTPRDLAFCAHAILSDQVMEVPDTLLDERFRDNPLVLGQPRIRHYAGAPVILSDGLAMGTVCVIDHQPGRLDEQQREELRKLAFLAARLLEYRRSERQLTDALEATRRAERDIEAQRKRLELTIDGTQAATWEIDLQLGYARYNSRWRELFGSNDHDLGDDVAAGWVRGIHPEDRARAHEALSRHLGGLAPAYAVDVRRQSADYRWRWVEERGRIGRRGADQAPLALYGATLDVSERKHAQRALQAERDLFTAGPCAVLTWAGGPSWSVQTATSNIQGLLGFSAAELMAGQPPFLALAHPDDTTALQAAAQAVQGGTPVQHRLRLLHASGHYRTVALVLRPLEAQGTVGPQTIGYLLDTTEAAEVEAQVRRREQQLQAMVDSALDGIVSVNEGHLIVLFNPAATRLFGYTRDEALGLPLEQLIPERSRDRHRIDVTHFAAGSETAREMGLSRGLTGRHKDGSEFPIEATVSRSGAPGSEVYTAVVRDVSDRLKAQAALQAAQVAEQASRAKSEFLSRVSHELRNPLNAVLGYATLMLTDTATPLGERHRQHATTIHQSGAHLLSLIDDLLDLARIEHGSAPRQVAAVHLGEAVRSALALLAPAVAEQDLQVDCDAAAQDAWALGDARSVAQVLLNVMANAVKYNRRGGRLHIGCTRSGPFWQLAIQDTGHGIGPERLAHLFEHFNRLGAERTGIQGTGLGLVICRELVQTMDGQLSVASVEGEGSTVQIRLRACAPPPRESTPPAAEAPARARPRRATAQLLYIEDDAVNAMLFRELMVQRAGWQLTVAATGQAGVAAAIHLRPDVVITDMNLPDQHGLDVIRQLRQHEATRHLLVVALSADAMDSQIQRALEAGADEYWTKPLDLAHALRRLDSFSAGDPIEGRPPKARH